MIIQRIDEVQLLRLLHTAMSELMQKLRPTIIAMAHKIM